VHIETLSDETDIASGLMLAAAEKEMCAFLRAVSYTFGLSAAERASDLWIAAFDQIALQEIAADGDFRRITIHAAAELAADVTRGNIPDSHLI
jgi:hypothetical protein